MTRILVALVLVGLATPIFAASNLGETPPTAESVAAEKADRAAKKEAKAAKKQAKRDAKIEEALAENKDVVTFYTNSRMDFVKLETMSKGEAKDRGAQHPAMITADQMKQYLSAILVSEKDLLKKSPDIVQVFSEKAADFLGPILAKAFSKAKPDQVVVFSWLTKDPLIVIRNDRIVIAECWVKDNVLHMQFNKLLAKLNGDYDKRGNFDFVINNAKGLRIKLLASAVVTPAGRGGKEAMITMDGDFAAVTAPDVVVGNGDAQKVTAQRSVKDRLTDLDQLRKDKMITEAEYQTKRKKLLESL
jgi:hypothetical protein